MGRGLSHQTQKASAPMLRLEVEGRVISGLVEIEGFEQPEGGGTLKNIVSGKEVRLYARQGVYFFKSTILPPGSIDVDPSSPFARQG